MIKKLPVLLTAAGVMASIFAASPAMADDAPTPAPSTSTNTTLPPGTYSGGSTAVGDWQCDMFATGHYAPCVQNEQTSQDVNWYKGYKLTFNWTAPTDWQGNAYDRCVLSYYNPATDFNAESIAPIQIDVPASWGSYTIPLSQYGWLQDGITAGATTLKEEYYCYTDGVGSSERVTSQNAIIPDMPPTQPTQTTTTVDQDDVTVTGGGSVALGVSPVQGYSLTLTDASTGAVVDNETATVASGILAGGSARVHTASKSTKPVNAFSKAFKNLKPGTYKVAVASYNKIGQSDKTVKTVVVKAVKKVAKLANARAVAAKVTANKVKVTWQAPKGTSVTGYKVALVKNGKVVKTVKLSKTKHAYTFNKINKGTYTVRVINTAAGNRSATVAKTVHVNKALGRH